MSCLVIGFEQEGEAVASRDLSREDRQLQYAMRQFEKMAQEEKAKVKTTPTAGGKNGDCGDKAPSDEGPSPSYRKRVRHKSPPPKHPSLK